MCSAQGIGPSDNTNEDHTMRPPKLYPNAKHQPGQILGYRRNGVPIYAIAGGSEGPPEPPPGTTITVPKPVEPPPSNSTQSNGQTFTAADIEAARQQEKDKLYDRLNKQDEVLKKLQDEQQERLAAQEKARKDAEDAVEAERQKNLTFEQKLAESEAQWAQRFEQLNGQVAQSSALLEAERRFQALQEFRTRRLQEESEHIMPNLHAFVQGGTEEEIEASLSQAKDATTSILGDIAQAQQNQQYAAQQARQQARGTGVTAPPVGPMENNPGQETYSADDIRNMDMATYAKNRARLLDAANNQMRGRG